MDAPASSSSASFSRSSSSHGVFQGEERLRTTTVTPRDPPAPFGPGATRRVRPTVRVGVGVVVTTADGRLYVGRRRGSHGAGTWALPGGHLEMYESWADCARREVLEEMNLPLSDNEEEITFVHVTNDLMPEEDKHYVTLFMLARPADPTAVPMNMEPDKCEGWQAVSWEELRSWARAPDRQLFGPLRQLVLDEPPALLAFLAASHPTTATPAMTTNK